MRGASKLKPTPPGEDLLGAIGNPDVLCSAIAGEADFEGVGGERFTLQAGRYALAIGGASPGPAVRH